MLLQNPKWQAVLYNRSAPTSVSQVFKVIQNQGEVGEGLQSPPPLPPQHWILCVALLVPYFLNTKGSLLKLSNLKSLFSVLCFLGTLFSTPTLYVGPLSDHGLLFIHRPIW